VLTQQLQHTLQQQLNMPVEIAMRYGSPSIKDAYESVLRQNPQLVEVILLPLYPHYAMSSYETAVEDAKQVHSKLGYTFSINIIEPYYNEANYIDSLTTSIAPYLNDYDHILFSYHGVPERHIHKGDTTGNHCLKIADCCNVNSAAHKFCYRHQCYTTTRLVAEQLRLPKEKYSQSFQSRLGREEWLKPYTAVRLSELPQEGKKKILVVCPAFVSDCLETLEEIAQEGKHTFIEGGGNSFTMIPCLNVHPKWVETIVGWINKR
jgi:ferrochelatase